jgi:hypothetical protein
MTQREIEDNVRSVRAKIRYLSEGSFINRRYVSAGVERNTGVYEDHEVSVRDARSIKEHFSLDSHGFMLAAAPSAVRDFTDTGTLNRVYAAEAEAIVKALTGADHVAAQGWMVRTSGEIAKSAETVVGYKHEGGIQPPAGEAHVDYSPQTAPRAAERAYRKRFPDGKGYSRYIATSLWRTFSPPPQDCPLALCDGRSLADEEGTPNRLVIVDAIPSDEEMRAPLPGEDDLMAASIFRYRPEHRWWYFSNMTRDEVLLFKFFDSDHAGAWRCPHTAFFDDSLPDARPRSSIEIRTIAFFD